MITSTVIWKIIERKFRGSCMQLPLPLIPLNTSLFRVFTQSGVVRVVSSKKKFFIKENRLDNVLPIYPSLSLIKHNYK